MWRIYELLEPQKEVTYGSATLSHWRWNTGGYEL